jgi:hypothetical protein
MTFSMGIAVSGCALAPVKSRNAVRALTVGRRQAPHQTPGEQGLFVVAIKQNDFHDQVLALAEEKGNLWILHPLGRAQVLPGSTVNPELI